LSPKPAGFIHGHSSPRYTITTSASFESGLAASLFGPIIAVVAGRIGTILVVLIAVQV
jgi:hypothetical protein